MRHGAPHHGLAHRLHLGGREVQVGEIDGGGAGHGT
jgi:hypothetical protein